MKNGILANFADSSESIIRGTRQKFEFGSGPLGSDPKTGRASEYGLSVLPESITYLYSLGFIKGWRIMKVNA